MQAHCSVISEASTTPSNSLLSGSVLSTSIKKSYLCRLSEKCFLRILFMLSVLFLCLSLIFSDSPSGNHFPDTCLFSAGRRLSAGSRATPHTQRPPAVPETCFWSSLSCSIDRRSACHISCPIRCRWCRWHCRTTLDRAWMRGLWTACTELPLRKTYPLEVPPWVSSCMMVSGKRRRWRQWDPAGPRRVWGDAHTHCHSSEVGRSWDHRHTGTRCSSRLCWSCLFLQTDSQHGKETWTPRRLTHRPG